MYGVIFSFLRDYVTEKHGGRDTWRALLSASDISPEKIYFPVTEYPDEEIVAIATSAAEALDLPLPVVLEDFGSFVAIKLITFYPMYIDKKDLDSFGVIELAGSSIHDAIHKHNPQRKPPTLGANRVSENEMILHYFSGRKLCPVVRGVIRGLSEHFDEVIEINETQCMHEGAPHCSFDLVKEANDVPVLNLAEFN